MSKAKLILESRNGNAALVFEGFSFGAEKSAVGEVVFNTAMTGYPETLTDPSYAGQLLVMTYPLVGNYGVPPQTIEPDGLSTFMESERIHVRGLIVSDYSETYSHWNADGSLGSWLQREGIPAITGIDTRSLTQVLRQHGVMMGRIVVEKPAQDISSVKPQTTEDYGNINFIEQVSCKEVIRYNEHASSRVVLVDCGVKHNIIRCLLKHDVEVIRVPWDYDFTGMDYDGLFLANGPGNPDTAEKTVAHVRRAMHQRPDLPIFGICMGNQLLAKAAGGKVYKLKYGHRSHNQPVMRVGSNRCYITSQNHGYAVDAESLGEDWKPLFINMNDQSNEGIINTSHPWFSVQFHPEAAAGPTDTMFLFDEFVKNIQNQNAQNKK